MPDSLFVRLPNWVGDACMCLPALSLLQRSRVPLVLCGRPWAQDLLAGLDAAAFVPMGGGLAADLAAIRSSSRPPTRQSAGLLFTNSFSTAALFRIAGIAAAGQRGDGRSLLLKWPLARADGLHEVEVFFRLASYAMRQWGAAEPIAASPPPRLRLPITTGHAERADRALAQAGIAAPFVLLSPIATGLHHGKPKAWPLFGEFAAALERQGWTCVICPPANEEQQARSAVPSARVLPPLSLGAFAALTQRAALTVCNDSGTSHVAAAAGARQITLFGVTRPARTGPWSPDAIRLGSEHAWPSLAEVLRTATAELSLSAPVSDSTPSPRIRHSTSHP